MSQNFNDTHVEGKLAREVVHAAGMHQTQRVSHSSGAQHTLARDWTDAPVGQRGGHDTSWLTVDLNGTQLEMEVKHVRNLLFIFCVF